MESSKQKRILAVIILSLSFLVVIVGITRMKAQGNLDVQEKVINYRDYSSVGVDYKILDDILIKADSVDFKGVKKDEILGTELQFSKFAIVAPVKVQVSDTTSGGIYVTATGRYSLLVAHDDKDIVYKKLVQEILSYWESKTAEEMADYKVLPSEKSLCMKSGRYVLYIEGEGEWPGSTNLYYVEGKVLKLTFDGFEKGNGGGGLTSFSNGNLSFNFPDTQIQCDFSSASVNPQQFLKLYRNGFFDEPPTKEPKKEP